jgi:hypothetical protein
VAIKIEINVSSLLDCRTGIFSNKRGSRILIFKRIHECTNEIEKNLAEHATESFASWYIIAFCCSSRQEETEKTDRDPTR